MRIYIMCSLCYSNDFIIETIYANLILPISYNFINSAVYEDISKIIPISEFATHVRKMRMEKDSGFKKEFKVMITSIM